MEEKLPPIPKNENAAEIRKRFTKRKLKNKDVYEIRRRYLDGETKASLRRRYAVSGPTIDAAIHGLKTYKDV